MGLGFREVRLVSYIYSIDRRDGGLGLVLCLLFGMGWE